MFATPNLEVLMKVVLIAAGVIIVVLLIALTLRLRPDLPDDLPGWQSRLRVLAGWKIQQSEVEGCQVLVDRAALTATVLGCRDGGKPADYDLHEILHVALVAREVAGTPAADESLVQDLSSLIVLCR